MHIVTIPMTPFVTNCYVVQEEKTAVVIDPGDVSPALLEAIDGYEVRLIVNTHGHCDHCGGNAELKRQTGARIALHREDLPLLRTIKEQGALFGVPFPDSPEPDVFLENGDLIRIGGGFLEVRHTPGHTPGHIVLVYEDCAFVGDVIFAGSIGRTDLPGGDHAQLLASIHENILVMEDCVKLYPGHGNPTSVGAEKRSNPFLAPGGWYA